MTCRVLLPRTPATVFLKGQAWGMTSHRDPPVRTSGCVTAPSSIHAPVETVRPHELCVATFLLCVLDRPNRDVSWTLSVCFSLRTAELPGPATFPERLHGQLGLQRGAVGFLRVLPWLRSDRPPGPHLSAWDQQKLELPFPKMRR